MKREAISAIFPEANEEQITAMLNAHHTEVNDYKSKLSTVNGELSRLKDGPTAEKLQAETERADGLQRELDALKNADALRQLREKVAGEKKIPVSLLTADTEDACKAQADAILAFAKPNGDGNYPTIKDGGTPGGDPAGAQPRDSFANWFNQNS